MLTKSIKYLKKFNKRSDAWLVSLRGFSQKELDYRLEENTWSLGLLFDHIMKVAYEYQIYNAEKASHSVITQQQKNAFGILLFDVGIQPRFNFQIEDFPQDLREKFTPEHKSKAQLIKEFITFIDHVNTKFKQLSGTTHGVVQHPMFGKINTLNWLRLIEIHLKHHEKQRRKIIKAIQK